MASNADEGHKMPSVPPELGEYEQLIDDYSHFAPPAEGEVLAGHVLKVTENEVIVDFGYKSEGLVPISQFIQPDGRIHVQPGDTIDVVIDRKGEETEGYVLLSHEKAGRLRAWDNLEKAFREKLLISGRVLGRIKGGLAVDVGKMIGKRHWAAVDGRSHAIKNTTKHFLGNWDAQGIPQKTHVGTIDGKTCRSGKNLNHGLFFTNFQDPTPAALTA
jgi:ribosomal protein S1